MFPSELHVLNPLRVEKKVTMANFLFVMRNATRALDSDGRDFSRLSSKEQSLIHSMSTRISTADATIAGRHRFVLEKMGEKKGNIYQYKGIYSIELISIIL